MPKPKVYHKISSEKLFVQQIMFSCFPAYVFFQSLINVKRSISLVLPRNTPSNRCMEPADLSSMVLPAGVQFVFNISKIQSPFKIPELVFLWGEEVIISNFCLTYLDPILLLKKLSIFHFNSHSTSFFSLFKKYRLQKTSFLAYRKILSSLMLS